jgi:hypothetical protein
MVDRCHVGEAIKTNKWLASPKMLSECTSYLVVSGGRYTMWNIIGYEDFLIHFLTDIYTILNP